MPALIPVLWGFFILIAGSLVKRVIIGLGFGVMTFIGSKIALQWFLDGFLAKFNSLPSELGSVVALLGVGNAVSIIMSAITIRLVMNGLSFVNDRNSNLRFLGNKTGFWS